MHKISDKDKKVWNYYISNLNLIKKVDDDKKINLNSRPEITRILRPNHSLALDSKTKKKIKKNKLTYDAIIDLHGKTEAQAYNIIKNFIEDSYFNNLKNVIIITGKGANSKGILKLKTPMWLKNEKLSKFVVGYETMAQNKGGEGALFVILRDRNKYKK